MSPLNSFLIRAAVAASLSLAIALACGPFFGIEVLTRRKEVLLAPPTVSFERELRALVPKPQDELPVVETEDKTRDAIEGKELTADVLDRVKKMREQISGEAAYGLGDGLAPAVREYTAGAVSFLHGDTDGARVHFQAVVTLPEAEQRRSRELWAHYMLGRMAVKQRDQEEGVKQFEATRAVVRNGMPDPLGLALASYGEEARGAWQQGLTARAVELYATQAAYGSDTALNSLVMVAGLILKDGDLLDKGIQDARTRRLLFICVNENSGRAFFVGLDAEDSSRDAAATADPSTVDRLVSALERRQLKAVDGAGLLASAAYRVGRFDLAQRLCVLEDGPLSDWVKAKLALRRGDREAALRAYQKALEGFAEQQYSTGEVRNIKAETSVLRVSRGDYLQALDLLYGAAMSELDPPESWSGFDDYWADAAYLAERVLTIAELKDYIDHHVENGQKGKLAIRLRSLLARRMMRAGKRAEALRYFDDKDIRDAAQKYGNALDKANSAWRPGFLRAKAWFDAANIARTNGLEILGFEREPDWAMWEGNFESNEEPPKQKDLYESEDERKRVAASKPERPERFQYRLTAVEHAKHAADLLPAKSQAYAAVLCEATAWVIDREPNRAADIYKTYLHNGAYVKWGRGFARTCPAPDFRINRVYGISRTAARWQTHVKVHPAYAGLGVLSAVALVAGFYWWRRRTSLY